ncbi:hypothetical protein GUJ93_ZPchr0005g15733 [Zizania palustris]|uniref:Uncharacterized protein n=1 Tax=Zizania palustris TaxID=103762 RepID=A0A8J5W1D4_ZIZPA|nr:hypothetical protein GUJ93_ZPchr0005g15733 [Zizania palustris]
MAGLHDESRSRPRGLHDFSEIFEDEALGQIRRNSEPNASFGQGGDSSSTAHRQASTELVGCIAEVLVCMHQLFGSNAVPWIEGGSIFEGPIVDLEAEKWPFEKPQLSKKSAVEGAIVMSLELVT